MKILFLNSGGKDSDLALQLLLQDNPDAEIHSLNIETNDIEGMEKAKQLAEKFGLPHFVLPYEQTRQFIQAQSKKVGAAAFWSFDLHLKGLQYASSNGYDVVASGHDSNSCHPNFEDVMNAMMDCSKYGKRVGIARPLKHVKTTDEWDAMKAKVRNPR